MSRRVVILLLVLLGVSALGWWILSRIERIEQDVATTKNRTALDSLAYISSVQDDDPREGVIRHDPQRSQPGFNLVTSWSRKTTELQDLEGETMHTWSTGAAGYAIPWQNRIYVVREDK